MQAGARMQLTVRPIAEEITATRRQFTRWARRRLAEERADDFELMASEALTNAVRHGDGRSPIHAEAWVENNSLCMEIVNRAERFAPPAERAQPGGMGLPIIARAADRWGVEGDQQVRLWFCFEDVN
jgi:anti-sigma regulatory factor (Ser/Thr protein kinase)